MNDNDLIDNPDQNEEPSLFDEPVDIQKLYAKLVEITQNELSLPHDLLPYESTVVNIILERIGHMNDVMNETKNRWSKFAIEQHKLELERFSYLLNSYLRTRLKKIEEDARRLVMMFKTDISKAMKFLSPFEAKFLDKYVYRIDKYVQNEVLNEFVPTMEKFHLAGVPARQYYRYAFVFGVEDGKVVDGDNEINIEPNVCRILSVPAIVEHLLEGPRCFKLI